MRNIYKNKRMLMILGVLSIVLSLSFIAFYKISKKSNPTLDDTAMVKKVSRHIVLPEETPKVVPIRNIEDLKREQPFFLGAKNGDIVIVYSQKVILFDPVADKVIEVATIKPETASKAKVLILNGTSITGLTKKIDPLISSIDKIEIIGRGNTEKNGYTATLVIDLTGKQDQLALTIANAVTGSVKSLPEGEIRPDDTDFIIIAGEDKK